MMMNELGLFMQAGAELLSRVLPIGLQIQELQ